MRNARSLNFSMRDLNDVAESVFDDALWAEVTTVDLSKNKLQQVPNGLVSYIKNNYLLHIC